jgi:hypothetical protein
MLRKALLFLFTSLLTFPALAQLNGTYSIDAGSPASATNYQTVASAISDLSAGTRADGGPINGPGVTGAVVLRLEASSGPYVEQISIPLITGVSATNTIRLTGGPSLEMITFSGTSTGNRQVIKLDGARHIILDSLTILNTDATYGYGVHITNSADSNIVSNCDVITNTTATSTNFAGVTISGATVATNGDFGDDNLIQGNTIIGGYYGVTMRGSGTTNFNQRNRVIDNVIRDFYYYGVYCYYQNLTQINGNTITARATGAAAGYGTYLNYVDLFTVESNRYYNLGATAIYASNGNYQGGTGTGRARIINNMIGGGWIDTTPYGIYLVTNSRHLDIWHNSVSMNNGNSRGLYMTSGLGNDVRNNSFAIYNSTTGYAIYISAVAYVTAVDYNNYYAPGSSNFIYIGAAYTTATYVGGGGFNVNSRNGDPVYQNLANNLHTTGNQLHDGGTNVGVTTDIDGDPRPLAPTALYDIGADEFTPSLNDAGVTALTSPAQPFGPGVQTVNTVIYNYGSATLTSATINWDVNSVLQTPAAWTGSLATFTSSTPFTLGTFNFLPGNTYNMRFWTSNPNGVTDDNMLNDTLYLSVCVGLNGVYTIGGGGADFPTINAAVAALVCGGVTGPVTMNLTQGAGPFVEQVVIPSIPGASVINTIRFNGGANRETVTFGATTTALRAVIQLDGARHVTLDSLTITNTGATYGYGVQLTNSADSNAVKNSVVNVSLTSTSSNFAGITISGATITTNGDFGDGNLIQGNTVNGGYYGITMRGTSTTVFGQSNKIIGNTLQDFYYYGVYSYYQNLVDVIGNTVSARPTSSTAAYGLYLYYNDRFVVENNVLQRLGGTGIYTYYGNYQGNTVSTRARIVNNMVGGGWRGTTPYGIYLATNSRYIDVWHNSVSMDDGNGRALYITSGTGNDVQNNSFAVFGTTTGYAAYISSVAYVSAFDYNNFYAPGSSNFVYVGAAYSVATYVGGGGFNFNSRDGNPFYINNANDLHAFSAQLYDAGTNLGVMNDIDGDPRPLAPSVGYDIGADEYGVVQNDVVLVSIYTPSMNSCADSNTVVSVIVSNFGSNTVTTLPITVNYSGFTSGTVNTTYSGSLVFGQSDTIVVGSFNSNPGGSLTITAYSALAGDQNTTNDTLTTTITVLAIAPVAVAPDDTACAGSSTTLSVNADGFAHNWYSAPVAGTLLAVGDTFNTPPMVSNTTYYVEALTRSNGSLATTYAGGNGCDGAMFDIVPSVNIMLDSFACNIGSTVSETVAVFYRNGTYVGNETNSAAWTMAGTVTVTGAGAGNPTLVPIGGIPMTAGQTYGIYMMLASANIDYTTATASYANTEVTINTGAGLCAAFSSVNAGRSWNGEVYYTKEVCPNPVRTVVNVTVLTPPSVSLGADTTVCGAYTLNAGNPGNSFVWSTGDTTQTTTAPSTGNYYVSVNDGQCISSDTILLTVNPLPVLNVTTSSPAVCIGQSDTLTVSGATFYTWSSGGNSSTEIVTPFATTTYTVYGLDNNGCVDSVLIPITVNALPTVGSSASSPAVCSGSTVTLNGTGASTYTWTGGVINNVAFAPVSTSTYTVTGVDANGCSDTAVATVMVNPLPSVSYTASATTVCSNSPVTLSGTGATSYSWTGSITDNVPFNAMATTTYTVTGTDANGCQNTASVTITVNPSPNVGILATATEVCQGGTISLAGTGAISYSWSPVIVDNSPFVPAASGVYTVTGTNSNGCTDTASVSITVNPLPNVTISLPYDTVCMNEGPQALSGASPSFGTWGGPGVSGTTFNPSVGTGTHTISYTFTDGNGCTDMATANVVVDLCTDVADLAGAGENFQLFPNPNNGQFTIDLQSAGVAQLYVYDALGQLVKSQQLQPGAQQVALNVSTGIYLLRVITPDGKLSQQRVVVE